MQHACYCSTFLAEGTMCSLMQHVPSLLHVAGVLVVDRVNGVAYVALSERADKELAEQWVSPCHVCMCRQLWAVVNHAVAWQQLVHRSCGVCPELCLATWGVSHGQHGCVPTPRVLLCGQVTSLGYKELVTFHSFDKRGKSVYHTNVMMAIGTDVAVVCAESVTDDKERQNLLVRQRMVLGRPTACPQHWLLCTQSCSSHRFSVCLSCPNTHTCGSMA